jgi:MFS family permease
VQRFSPPAWVSLPLYLATINLFSNCAVETSNVFISLYANEIGSTNLQVGLIAATNGIAYLVASFWFGRLSDMRGRLRYIRIGLALTAAAYLSQFLARTPLTLLIARGLVGFAVGINSSVIMAYTYENRNQIGNFISYGALGWLFGAMIAAMVKNYQALFIISACVALVPLLIAFLLKEKPTKRVRVAMFPVALIKADYKIYLGFFLRQFGGMAIWTIWPLYLYSIGASKLWIAIIEAANMVGQIVAMRYIERFNPVRMFQAGLLLSGVVFVVYGLVNRYWQVVPVQLVLAVGYSSLFVGALSYLLRFYQQRGTISGLLNSTTALSGSVGPLLGGAVSQAWGYATVMYVGAAITFLGALSTRGLKLEKKS